MPEYASFLKSFFNNHASEDPAHNFLRYLSSVRLMVEVEEDVYVASREEIEKLFKAYDEITGRNHGKQK